MSAQPSIISEKGIQIFVLAFIFAWFLAAAIKVANQWDRAIVLLEPREVERLAGHLGIDWISPPRSLPKSWLPKICDIKYVNPNNEDDYVVLVSARSIFGIIPSQKF